MATQPDSPPDTIQPQSPDEFAPLPNDPEPAISPQEEPLLPPDTDQPDSSPQEMPEPM